VAQKKREDKHGEEGLSMEEWQKEDKHRKD
jgi:hypothetical protein